MLLTTQIGADRLMRGQQKNRQTSLWRRCCAALICFAIALWAAIPVPLHAPSVLETLQDHAAFIAEHGHSHDFEEELAAAMHGHSHDAVEHDHTVATLVLVPMMYVAYFGRDLDRPAPCETCSGVVLRIERPPRV